jgi:putative spermidine/putrescine transport system substrate-binding protein
MHPQIRRLYSAVLLLAFVAVGNVALIRSAAAQQPQLTVVHWGGALQDAWRETVLKPFEQKEGVKIVDLSPPSFAKIKAMVDAKNVEWDVVDVLPQWYIEGEQLGLYEPLDYKQIDATDYPRSAVAPSGVGNSMFASVIAYNTKVFNKGNHPTSWAEFWDVKKFPGRRGLQRSARYLLEAALMADGAPMDKLYPLDEGRAFQILDRIKPYVTNWWTAGNQPALMLASGQLDLSMAFTARVYSYAKEGAPVDIEWNQGIYGYEYYVIPKGSRNKELAMKFLNWALSAKPNAEYAIKFPQGPVNRRSTELIPADIANWLPSTPKNNERMIPMDAEYWAKNEARVKEKVEEWLVK